MPERESGGAEADISMETISLSSLSSSSSSQQQSVRDSIRKAFGPLGPGILLVSNLPDSYSTQRNRLLAAGHALPSLPQSQLSKLEFPRCHYSVGWSKGRERFKGVTDSAKASFYANPIYDEPSQGHPHLAEQYPYVSLVFPAPLSVPWFLSPRLNLNANCSLTRSSSTVDSAGLIWRRMHGHVQRKPRI